MFDNKKIVFGVLILFVAYFVDYYFIHSGENTVVDINNGKLKGIVTTSRNGREYYEFLGIPYAEPPIGKLRFMSPKPNKAWTGVRDATKYQSKCMQVDMLTNVKGGSEDCLYLNVFSPKTTTTPSLFPVLVYFHGGHFMNGDAKMFGPKYFMDEDVILVTVNYRLASLGFLNAGNKYARGNQGLKDQVQALKWVQKNIPYFSGDPNRVILFGQSAGASSAHLHMLSKMSTGLFHGVMSASGTAGAPFAFQKQPIEQAKRLGKKLRCPSNRKTEAMVACLGQAEVQRLVESHREAVHFLHDPINMYGPTVEVVDDDEAFLTKEASKMLKAGERIVNNVPWIVGVTSNEGLANAATILRNSSMMQVFEDNWEDNFSKVFLYKSEDSSVHRAIREFYYGKTEGPIISRDKEEQLSKMFGDRMHLAPTHNSAIAHAKKNANIYLYQFSEPSAMSYADVIYNQNGILPPVVEIGAYIAFKWVVRLFSPADSSPADKGVSHFDDQTFFFNIPFMPEYNPGDVNYEFSKDVVKLWVSFAKDGKPSDFKGISWSPVDTNAKSPLKYLEISKHPKLIQEPFADRVQFWNSLNLR